MNNMQGKGSRLDRNIADSNPTIEVGKLVELLLAVWRTQRRAGRAEMTPETVLVACESTLDRVHALGFRLDDMLGQPYHENMRVRVVDQEGDTNLCISECLAPAVYYQNRLIRPAEVVISSKTAEES